MIPEPLVSVIMPAYNSSGFIKESAASVLSQTYKNIELIIVDDGSADDTFNAAEKIAQTDSRVKFYSIPHAGRPSVPRNFGIGKSSGELIAFIDSDDLWIKDKLERQVKFFKRKINPVFVYSMSVTFGSVNIFSPLYEVLPLPFKAAKSRDALLKTGNTIPLSSVLADAAAVKSINGFDEDPDLQIEDYDLWLHLSELGSFYFFPRLQVFYRIHDSQFSADWETRKARMNYLSRKRGLRLPELKLHRRKGVFLIIRNAVHFKVYLLMRLLDFWSRIGK